MGKSKNTSNKAKRLIRGVKERDRTRWGKQLQKDVEIGGQRSEETEGTGINTQIVIKLTEKTEVKYRWREYSSELPEKKKEEVLLVEKDLQPFSHGPIFWINKVSIAVFTRTA